ncbi:MAG: 2OG-Fe(II) oxygenase family protein [Coxiellaceae bacterium]|nr:2OG-Fe(II) oxygenase family protein [Coxiellaceae bacterium]
MSIQVVDFTSPNAAQQFATSLRETGFGVLQNHPVDQQLINHCYRDWEAFFKSDDKHNYEFDPATHDGHISYELSETAKGHAVQDLKEFYHLYDWGRCPDYLRPQTIQLMSELSDMAETLLMWLDRYLPINIHEHLSVPLSEMLKGSNRTLFRLIHYPPLRGDEAEGAVRAAQHEDIDLLTLLPAATAEGLQAQIADGQWVDVPINPNWIIVNAGDMLQEATSCYYPSTTHRVANPVGELAKQSRLSMPLFLHPQDDVVLSDKYTAESYRQERFAELGLV